MNGRTILAICALCSFTPPATAEMSGNNLKEYCDFYPKRTEASTLCMGYISGTLDALRTTNKIGPPLFCEPVGTTGEQFIDLTKKYLHENPDGRHLVAANSILLMMQKTFPCK